MPISEKNIKEIDETDAEDKLKDLMKDILFSFRYCCMFRCVFQKKGKRLRYALKDY